MLGGRRSGILTVAHTVAPLDDGLQRLVRTLPRGNADRCDCAGAVIHDWKVRNNAKGSSFNLLPVRMPNLCTDEILRIVLGTDAPTQADAG